MDLYNKLYEYYIKYDPMEEICKASYQMDDINVYDELDSADRFRGEIEFLLNIWREILED